MIRHVKRTFCVFIIYYRSRHKTSIIIQFFYLLFKILGIFFCHIYQFLTSVRRMLCHSCLVVSEDSRRRLVFVEFTSACMSGYSEFTPITPQEVSGTNERILKINKHAEQHPIFDAIAKAARNILLLRIKVSIFTECLC